MKIEQFYDENLAQASYMILSEGEAAVIDPSRDVEKYILYARNQYSVISTVIETHPHADFVSGHLELANRTGANIYVSKLFQPEFAYIPFDEQDIIKLGAAQLQCINTPGHSPDSISILLKVDDKIHAVFTGDTLFAGDLGRPDLREGDGNLQTRRENLAKAMFKSVHQKLMPLPSETIVSPAHGAGSLCGKNISSDRITTIGREKERNYALQIPDEPTFVNYLLKELPYTPKYFNFDVIVNKKGAISLEESLKRIPEFSDPGKIDTSLLVVDTRKEDLYKDSHLEGSINIPLALKFETWLGTIITPGEKFYLLTDDRLQSNVILKRVAKIGYDVFLEGIIISDNPGKKTSKIFKLERFRKKPQNFTILDVRNKNEAQTKIFENSINIPLPELRERIAEIPDEKPLVVHCAGGYRSAIAFSILKDKLKNPVYDLGVNVNDFKKDPNLK